MIFVPAGWISDEPGYWMPVSAGREITESWNTVYDERDRWMRAYEQMKAEHKRYRGETDGLLASLELQIEAERSAWQKTARRPGKSGIGIFGGYDPFREQAVAGIGYVLILF